MAKWKQLFVEIHFPLRTRLQDTVSKITRCVLTVYQVRRRLAGRNRLTFYFSTMEHTVGREILLYFACRRALPSPRQTPFVPKFAKLHAITAASRNSLACFKSRHWTRGEVNTADPIVSSSLLVSPASSSSLLASFVSRLIRVAKRDEQEFVVIRDEISTFLNCTFLNCSGIILKLLLDGWKTSSLINFHSFDGLICQSNFSFILWEIEGKGDSSIFKLVQNLNFEEYFSFYLELNLVNIWCER